MAEDQHPQPSEQATPPPSPRRGFVRRMVSGVVRVTLTAAVVLAGIWAVAALSMADLDGASRRIWLPCVFGLAFLAVIILVRPHRRGRLIAAGMVVAVAAWY